MKIPCLVLIATLWLTRVAFSEEPVTPEPSVKVVPEKASYSAKIPRGLKAFLPRGGTTRFWGASALAYKGKQVWVHVYNVSRMRKPRGQEDTVAQPSGLDLFLISNFGRLKKLTTKRFKYDRYAKSPKSGAPESVGVETTWLNLNERKQPVVIVHFRDPNGFEGPILKDAIAVFGEDFKNAIVDNRFGSASTNSSDWNWWSYHFGQDKNGFVTIESVSGTMYGTTEITYQWRGKSFVAIEKRTHLREGGENGESTTEVTPLDTQLKFRQPLPGFGVGYAALAVFGRNLNQKPKVKTASE